MKLVHGLLFIIAASSVESQHLPKMNANDMLHDNHLISSDMTDGLQKQKPKYTEYQNSRCRTDKGKEGKDGKEYKMYSYKKHHYEKDDCKNKCSSDHKCTGFEFKEEKGCEVWHKKSKKQRTHKEKDAYCYWKEEEEEKEVEYKKYKNRRCRTDNGKEGEDGDEYDMYYYDYHHYDKDDCKKKCSSDPDCTGFEFKKKMTCEIWYEKSKKQRTHKDKDAYCYWKK